MGLYEDNLSGFHSGTVHTGVHRSVTGGNDAPLDVSLPQLKQSAKQAKDILMGKDGGSVHTDSHDVYNIDNSVHIDQSVHHSGVADGLAWFGTHFKEIAIVAAASAAVLAIAKLIKGVNKSIKFRYNKVVKTLQKAQYDFTMEENGLDMKAVLPGIGSRINDGLTRFFSGLWSRKKHKSRGNIGLHPFCQQYIDEIEADYRTATAAFSKIKVGSEKLDSKESGRNTDASVGGAAANVSTSAYSGKIYSSFHEAYSDELLNEGVSPDKLDESILAAISAGVALTSLAVKAGSFLYQRFKNGKPVGEPKAIQVTAESTREICYAIINNFADKYVNMSQVFKELGIDSNSLSDLDKSSVDKLRTILEKYQKPEKNSYTKQYTRINDAYKKMLKHYYNIGDGIIDNFVKYSEASDEKHSNLIVASKEKLKNMWDSQKEFYDNNFSHIMIEIVSCEAYIKYLDFIINKVLPVFKSGLAGDADYIFDVVPKKGEYYIIRQTADQAVVADGEALKGKAAIAEIVGFDKDSKKITFKFVGGLKDDNSYTVSDDGIATLDNTDNGAVDYDVYKDKGDIELEYGKWLSVDPIQLKWTPEKTSTVYMKRIDINKESKDCAQYVYSKNPRETADNGYDKLYLVTTKRSPNDVIDFTEIDYNGLVKQEDFDNMCQSDLGFRSVDVDEDVINYWNGLIEKNENKKDAGTIDEIVEIIKNTPEREEGEEGDEGEDGQQDVRAVSKLYKREIKNSREREIVEYAYAVIEESDESFKSCPREVLNEVEILPPDEKKGDDDSKEKGEKGGEENPDNKDDQGSSDDEPKTEDDGGTPIVEPGTDAATKDVVRMIICGNIDKASGKSIMDDVADNKFDGASITIDPACSIDDVDKEFERMGFEKVDEDANKIKGKMLQLVMGQSGHVRKSNIGTFKIDDIETAMKEVEDRENAMEKIEAESGKIADGIIEKLKGALTKSPKEMFGQKGVWVQNPEKSGMLRVNGKQPKIISLKKDFMDPPYIKYDLDIEDDTTGKNFVLYLYPTICKEDKVKTKDALEKGTAKTGVIIYLSPEITASSNLDKEEIENTVKNMFGALVEGGKLEPSRFIPIDTAKSDEEPSGDDDKIDVSNLNDEQKKLAGEIEELFNAVTVIETENGGHKFHNNGKKQDNIDLNCQEGDTDYMSISLKGFGKPMSLVLNLKNGKIMVKVAVEDKTSDEVELNTWTKVALFGVANKLLGTLQPKQQGGEAESIDTSKMNDEQKKLVADIENLLKIVKVEKNNEGKLAFNVDKSKSSGNVSIVTKDGIVNTFTAHFNDFEKLIVLGNCNGGGVSMNVSYQGQNGTETPLNGWSIKAIYAFLSQIFGEKKDDSASQGGEPKENTGGETPEKTGESVNITYKTTSSVSESTYLPVVSVRRKISGRFKNWYVLSEAVYDDGSGYRSKLDSRRVVESMTDRSDFSRFAKSSKLAKFMPFESQQEYTLTSDRGYTPSLATPLYESVVLVKFDKMDNVVSCVMLGKHKIS